MAKDLMRMLTEITPTQQPVAGTPNFRGMFGQQQAQRLQGSLGSLARGGAPSSQARMGQALAGLNLNKPEDLAKLAKIQQGTGDFAGAAKTAAQIEAMKQATVTEDRAARSMEIAEETFQMKKAASERTLDQADAVLAQQGVSRAIFAAQARDNGNEPLARAIETGSVSLERAGSILFGSSNALVKPATPEEAEAFDRILETKEFKDKLEGFDEGFWWFSDKNVISSDTKKAIYFKAKELMARGKMSTEEALTQAIESVAQLDSLQVGGDDGDGKGGGGVSRKDRRNNKTGGNVPEAVEGSGDMFSGYSGTKGA